MRCCLYLKCSLSRLSVDYNCCQFCRKRNSKQIFEFLCSLELKTIGLQESSLNHPATPLYIYSFLFVQEVQTRLHLSQLRHSKRPLCADLFRCVQIILDASNIPIQTDVINVVVFHAM